MEINPVMELSLQIMVAGICTVSPGPRFLPAPISNNQGPHCQESGPVSYSEPSSGFEYDPIVSLSEFMLAFQVHRQPVDRREFSMHIEFKYVLACLWCRDISGIQVFFDFISLIPRDFQSGPVMAFIDVLVNVLDGFY